MTFELFTGRGKKRRSNARVTISRTGMISVNADCRGKYLKDTEAVQLLYDADTGRIGIKPVPKGTAHSYRFSGSKGGLISGSAFLREYALMPKKTKAMPAKWDNGAQAVVCKAG